jgi:hypothetical protein
MIFNDKETFGLKLIIQRKISPWPIKIFWSACGHIPTWAESYPIFLYHGPKNNSHQSGRWTAKITQRKDKTEKFGYPSPHSLYLFLTLYSSPSLMSAEANSNGGGWASDVVLCVAHTGEGWWCSAKLRQRLSLCFLKVAAYPGGLVGARVRPGRVRFRRGLCDSP